MSFFSAWKSKKKKKKKKPVLKVVPPSPIKPPSKDDETEAYMGREACWPHSLRRFRYEDLQSFTQDFSEDNIVCQAHFGKVYRGKIAEGFGGFSWNDVIVKTWKDAVNKLRTLEVVDSPYENLIRFTEMTFITSPSIRNHPNFANLIGYCFDDVHLCFVYDLKVSGVLRDFFAAGTLKWIDRINIALALARALEYLHNMEPQYLVRDLSAFWILLDQDFNPILFDFATMNGGVIGAKPTSLVKFFWGSFGYLDSNMFCSRRWSVKTDMYAFGVILLELICKKIVDINSVNYYISDSLRGALVKKSSNNPSCKEETVFRFANRSFHKEEGYYYADDDAILSKLARSCLMGNTHLRPSSMTEVVNQILDLQVTRLHGKRLGIQSSQ